jgi:hypothetical protein
MWMFLEYYACVEKLIKISFYRKKETKKEHHA